MPLIVRPTLICLTPVKNEAWILDRFLRCASLWADHIVVADQGSEDGSRDIARAHPKVTLIENASATYNEAARQRLLIDAARQIPAHGRRIMIALDADEMLSANWQQSPDWQRILSAHPGTVIRFEWVNILAGFENYWLPKDEIFGFVDDGSPHRGLPIHSPRVPVPTHGPALTLCDIKVLHYAYSDPNRTKSKNRWYQCWERVNNPSKRPVQLYRQYHSFEAPPLDRIRPFRREWLERYQEIGVEMMSTPRDGLFWWDQDIVGMLRQHGASYFRKVDIWSVDWNALSSAAEPVLSREPLTDPRTRLERTVHNWLAATQSYCDRVWVRMVQWALRPLGW